MRIVLIVIALVLLPSCARAADPAYLYDAKFVQAAPGRLLELIDLYKKRAPDYATSGDEAPLIIRHSQGDKWDLMLLLPVGSYSEYYQQDRVTKRNQVERQFAAKLKELIVVSAVNAGVPVLNCTLAPGLALPVGIVVT